ncbi:MAG TPA: phosphate signaling complex protein PhoU [Rhodocyclaceae bacterium]|nr:phosphate signaling complex protein PhoU [Rhodocyclaceae bacterium]
MSQHIVKQFDTDLEKLRNYVFQMGGMVEQQLMRAMEALEKGDLTEMEQVIVNDVLVNDLEIEIDEACTQVIAKRQPAAIDLRMILTVIRIINDLERIGDEAKKICKKARAIHGGDPRAVPRIDLHAPSEVALIMLRKSLDSFARMDIELSAEVVRQDRVVDDSFKGAMRQLITYMMEDPRTISSSLDLLFIARSIERVGDHAKNIAQYVVYLAQGRDVRHTKLDALGQ